MMKKLKLNEGDPVRLNGTALPKGKLVKIQAQSTDFLEVSDPKAVYVLHSVWWPLSLARPGGSLVPLAHCHRLSALLSLPSSPVSRQGALKRQPLTGHRLESALRYYSCLTKNDIIEITYNSLTFEFLIIETQPQPGSAHASPSGGISVIDTDLEVDFETPKGYVEPARPAPAPVPTMASKLKIDLGETTSADSTRPPSAMGQGGSGSGSGSAGAGPGGAGASLESFTGMGQSLSGKRIKGRGLSKKVEEVDPSSKINRNE